MSRFRFTLALLPLLAGAGGCSGPYDKELRLYLSSDAPGAAGAAREEGWYVVGARMPDAYFHELGIRYPAGAGERLELRREGEAIVAAASGFEVPVKDVPADAVYIAWARQNFSPDFVERRGPRLTPSRRRGGNGTFLEVLLEWWVDELLDDDEDTDLRRARDDDDETDRGKRYERSSTSDDGRQRTRDD